MFWAATILVVICIVLLVPAYWAWILGWRPRRLPLRLVLAVLGAATAAATMLLTLTLVHYAPAPAPGPPRVPLVSLEMPEEVRGGQPSTVKLSVRDPDYYVFAESEIEAAIIRADPSVVEAHLSAPGFDIEGGQPVRQGLGPRPAEWAWTLKSQPGWTGERHIQVALFDAEDRDAPVRLGTVTRTVRIEAASSSMSKVSSFLREFGAPVATTVLAGTLLLIISWLGGRWLKGRGRRSRKRLSE